MKHACGERMESIAGCCTAKCPGVTSMGTSSNGMERVSTLKTASGRKKPSDRARGNSANIAAQLERERARLVEAQEVAKIGSWEAELAELERDLVRTNTPHL